jgi:hypothetical protein
LRSAALGAAHGTGLRDPNPVLFSDGYAVRRLD